jgi:hypothetical protein
MRTGKVPVLGLVYPQTKVMDCVVLANMGVQTVALSAVLTALTLMV